MTISEKLSYVYINFENWHKSKLSYRDSLDYHNKYIESGNIKYVEVEGHLLGYIEIWFINDSQLNRLKNKELFFNYEEDLISGDIIYVANMWIHHQFRDGRVLRIFKNILRDMSKDYKLLAWHRNNQDYKQIVLKQGVSNG